MALKTWTMPGCGYTLAGYSKAADGTIIDKPLSSTPPKTLPPPNIALYQHVSTKTHEHISKATRNFLQSFPKALTHFAPQLPTFSSLSLEFNWI